MHLSRDGNNDRLPNAEFYTVGRSEARLNSPEANKRVLVVGASR